MQKGEWKAINQLLWLPLLLLFYLIATYNFIFFIFPSELLTQWSRCVREIEKCSFDQSTSADNFCIMLRASVIAQIVRYVGAAVNMTSEREVEIFTWSTRFDMDLLRFSCSFQQFSNRDYKLYVMLSSRCAAKFVRSRHMRMEKIAKKFPIEFVNVIARDSGSSFVVRNESQKSNTNLHWILLDSSIFFCVSSSWSSSNRTRYDSIGSAARWLDGHSCSVQPAAQNKI